MNYYRGFRHPETIVYANKPGEEILVQEGTADYAYLHSLLSAEESYLFLTTRAGIKPQFARDVLPLSLKTELIMTGTVKQWEEFFKLRCAPDAHPDAKALADNLREMFTTHGWYLEFDDVTP